MIEADRLTRRFAGRTAVDALTFTVPRAQVVGFLGPNGAGKSTTLKMLSGFLPPSSGTARIGGRDVVDEGIEARKLLGYMPESYPVYPEMRVEEFLHVRAELKGVRDRKRAVARAMELADVTDVARRLLGELSKGYKQRVGLADAVVASPPLLILDEPTEGLDPNQILRFREVIRGLGREHTVFLSTHILSEVEAVCSHVIIIHQGRIATQGALDIVRAELRGTDRVIVLTASVPERFVGEYQRPREALARVLREVEGARVTDATREASLLRVELSVPVDAPECVEAAVAVLVREGLGIREVTPRAHSLEAVFHALTRREEQKDGAVEAGS